MKRKTFILILVVIITFPILFLFLVTPGLIRKPVQTSIWNAHEHFQSFRNVPIYVEGMKRNDVVKSFLLGSPEATILVGREGFFGEEKYNLEVIKIANTYPDQFVALPTMDPRDPDKLKKFKQHLKMGAEALKLYTGHSLFIAIRGPWTGKI